jgi:cysteine desulfurase
LIVGLGKACEIISEGLDIHISSLLEKRNEIEKYYEDNNIGIINFKVVERAPHIVSITLNDMKAEDYLIIKSKEFSASTGSACNSNIVVDSHVLTALNKKNKNIIRISF